MYCLDHNEHTRSYMHETHTHTSNQRRKKNAHKPCVKCVISFITNLNDAFMIERRKKSGPKLHKNLYERRKSLKN